MAQVDFTTWLEFDPDSVLTVAADTITITGFDRATDTGMVQTDYGVGLGVPADFEHHVNFNFGAGASNTVFWNVWEINADAGIIGNNLEYDCVEFRVETGTARIVFFSRDGGVPDQDIYDHGNLTDTFWIKVINETCVVYSDAAETTVLDILTFTTKATFPVRYLKAFNTNTASGSGTASGTVNDFIIGPIVSTNYQSQAGSLPLKQNGVF